MSAYFYNDDDLTSGPVKQTQTRLKALDSIIGKWLIFAQDKPSITAISNHGWQKIDMYLQVRREIRLELETQNG